MRLLKAVGLVLGLTLLLGAMAPGAAQAWQINGEGFTGEETFSSSGGPFEIGASELSLTISCSKESGSDHTLSGSTGEGTLGLSGCKTVTPTSCTVQETIEIKAQFELKEVSGVTYAVFTPSSGSFASITLSGEKCTIAGKRELSGKTCAEVGPSAIELEFRFSAAIATSCGASELSLGTAKASITGTEWQALTGANAGEIWGVAPQPGEPDIGMALIPAGQFKLNETKEVKVDDLDGAEKWTLKEIGVTGSFGVKEAANCENKAVNMKKGEVCKAKVTCNEAGMGNFLAKVEYGGKTSFWTWKIRC